MTTHTLIIEPGLAERHYWRDLWRYRELFFVLAWRDVAVRYKQTIIGIAWALLQPFFTMVVFTVIFGKLAKMPTEGDAPYALLVYAGLLPWQFFASALSSASNSLIGNANLISKVYFPRLIIPFIVSMGLYVSPVGFSSSVIPEQWRLLYALNPMVGVIARNARDLARKTRDKIQGRPIGGTGGGTGDRPRFPKTPIQIPR